MKARLAIAAAALLGGSAARGGQDPAPGVEPDCAWIETCANCFLDGQG